ncbi:hypothetical protein [Maritalea porphyrae]|uniref:hypothetical protein n=1 Tax=Maritalea porphyrae TaxID=880732 RepID=UPI0022B008FA|nr:hypothetical protein [Maritalea porphyrae]MCZ4274024.1 hypothetical protein [Maritalea porphyrae]
MGFPDYLEAGQRARLLPVVSESNKENRLIGPVLGALPLIPELSKELLGQLGVKIGTRSKVSCFTEVVFKKTKDMVDNSSRPDGLIVVDNGRTQWRCLVEAKFGNNKIGQSQLERYLEIANKEPQIDAVLTVSNEFAATPSHSPVSISSKLKRKCDLFHLSWSAIATTVDLLLANDEIKDPDRALVLHELHEYLRHPASSIAGFTQMNKEWKDVVKALVSGARLPKNDVGVLGVVSSWHEEQKDMCLILSRLVKRSVTLKLPRAHLDSSAEWQKATTDTLLSANRLTASIAVPDAAGSLDVEAVLSRRTVTFGMRVKLPEDIKSTKARVNWLMKQLKLATDPRFYVRLNFPGRREAAMLELTAIREDPDILTAHKDLACTTADVLLVDDQGGKFAGSKTFIEQLENSLLVFYENAVANVRNWQPSAPKPVKVPERELEADDQGPEEKS